MTLGPISEAERVTVRAMLQRRQTDPSVRYSPGQLMAMRYELALADVERMAQDAAASLGAKTVALDELREQVGGGR